MSSGILSRKQMKRLMCKYKREMDIKGSYQELYRKLHKEICSGEPRELYRKMMEL